MAQTETETETNQQSSDFFTGYNYICLFLYNVINKFWLVLKAGLLDFSFPVRQIREDLYFCLSIRQGPLETIYL